MALAVGKQYKLRDGSTGSLRQVYTQPSGTFYSGSIAGDCLTVWRDDGTNFATPNYDILADTDPLMPISLADQLAASNMLLYPGRLDGYGASPWAWRDRQGYSGPIFGVIHGTADPGADAQGVFNWFMGPYAGNCSHFVIGKAGEVFQLADPNWASAANCCPSPPSPFQAYFPHGANANYGTTSFELLKNGVNNEDTPTDAQYASLIAVALWVTQINNIKPIWAADATGGWTSHSFLDPVHRPNNGCPGTFDWNRFFAGLQQTKAVNPHMQKQFDDVWLPATNGYKSGIYQIALKGHLAGKYSACWPTSSEIATVNDAGGAIQYQTLSNGLHAEYAAGRADIKDALDHIVFSGTL